MLRSQVLRTHVKGMHIPTTDLRGPLWLRQQLLCLLVWCFNAVTKHVRSDVAQGLALRL